MTRSVDNRNKKKMRMIIVLKIIGAEQDSWQMSEDSYIMYIHNNSERKMWWNGRWLIPTTCMEHMTSIIRDYKIGTHCLRRSHFSEIKYFVIAASAVKDKTLNRCVTTRMISESKFEKLYSQKYIKNLFKYIYTNYCFNKFELMTPVGFLPVTTTNHKRLF